MGLLIIPTLPIVSLHGGTVERNVTATNSVFTDLALKPGVLTLIAIQSASADVELFISTQNAVNGRGIPLRLDSGSSSGVDRHYVMLEDEDDGSDATVYIEGDGTTNIEMNIVEFRQ